MNLPRVIIAGTHSGVGKTTLTLGLISALRRMGLSVQAFKTGPDYIDPTYHAGASGRACVNLDSRLVSKDAVIELFKRRAECADFSVIEGVMGLYDGLKDTELGSTGHLAKILNSPVILMLNARSLSRSAAAIALGYKEFDRDVDIAGVVLNNIAGTNHYNYIKAAIERNTGIPVLGHLPADPGLKLSERHLGLIPLEEKRLHRDFYKRLSKLIRDNIDLTGILKIGRKAGPLAFNKTIIFKKELPKERVTIAMAKDEAFNFYYQDNLDILRHLGAKIATFSPLRDKKLPAGVHGLYIGGGFPELFARGLSKNKSLKRSIRKKAESGLPIYAECGGLMYLAKNLIDFKGRSFPMAGVFECAVHMGAKLHRLGYVDIHVINDNILSRRGNKNRAHLFHWSRLTGIPKNTVFAYKIIKAQDEIYYDGLVKANVLAGYSHLHFASNINFAANFIKSCREYRRSR